MIDLTKKYLTVVYDTTTLDDEAIDTIIDWPTVVFSAWGHVPLERDRLRGFIETGKWPYTTGEMK